ncbi:hypothetical protein VD0002_g9093 [Verticillium dahliae]|uniref:Uncharacterized protein n=2 Tax=Verticillium dahliae TaxID=27337 RepID=G2X6L8_VERDV|nr:uncharacterized protein VDAG_05800 [Verticillium dahliae VdLs.17]KAF3345809.1 Glucose-6-phosphate 1-dehydrogenase [Verticillium dahliae VDG2]KAH6708313.1 hypothetical protein EV126DRAFT_108620 [Verticillium dahliae]EGY14636.1 hypothetical protein VDAG_05800 [Verticillium dahliae VdLs.17]PNH35154.1 hypothetical protein BJF96_g1767 [Verticillium dahliae]PNH52298.1 hypothetical protein VD0003_g4981 [Verticillium dahliae]
MSTAYTGASGAEMLASHTLAQEIIARNSDADPVLDFEELNLLEHYVRDPSQAKEILDSKGYADEAQRAGSLVTHVISLHGTNTPGLHDGEIRVLREWFENGRAGKA